MAIGRGRNSTASSRAKTATVTAVPMPFRFSNEPLVAPGSAVWNANFDAPARRAHEELEREHLLPELRPFSQQEFPAPARAAGPKLLDPHRLQRRAAAQATIVATCGLRHFRRGHRSPSENHSGAMVLSNFSSFARGPRCLCASQGDGLVADLVLEFRVRLFDCADGLGDTLFREQQEDVDPPLGGLYRCGHDAKFDSGPQAEFPRGRGPGGIERGHDVFLRIPQNTL